jgi:hypothetical protein
MSSKRKIDPALQSLLQGLANSETSGVDFRMEARAEAISRLRDSYRRIKATDPAQFRPGDLVRWQPGMKDLKWPQYGESAVMVEVLDPPLLDDEQSAGTPYFRMPLTLVLGVHHKDGFHCWHFDGRRFELVS